MAATVVDSVGLICKMIEDIEDLSPDPYLLFVDLEGVNLSRHGSIAIMQVFVPALGNVYLVDVHTLQRLAFETSSASDMTLKTIVESGDVPKVFFDIRNDSDALYSHFQVDVHGVVDLQLLEFATRRVHGRFLKGLSKCISETVDLGWEESRKFQRVKDAGLQLFAPEMGGAYEVFNERPLPQALIDYCVQDVTILPKLLLTYSSRLSNHLAVQIHTETLRRIETSQGPSSDGKGRHMAVGPSLMWHRSSQEPEPCFPLSIVCSGDLSKYLSLATSQPAETVEQVQEDVTVDPVPSRERNLHVQPTTSLLAQLELLSVKDPLHHAEDADEDGKDANKTDEDTNKNEEGTDKKDNDANGNDEDDEVGLESYSSDHSPSIEDSEKDFTACSADDCGYCGHCHY